MSALELICASGLTQKRVRVRLKKARERGLLDFVHANGATLWRDPSARLPSRQSMCRDSRCTAPLEPNA